MEAATELPGAFFSGCSFLGVGVERDLLCGGPAVFELMAGFERALTTGVVAWEVIRVTPRSIKIKTSASATEIPAPRKMRRRIPSPQNHSERPMPIAPSDQTVNNMIRARPVLITPRSARYSDTPLNISGMMLLQTHATRSCCVAFCGFLGEPGEGLWRITGMTGSPPFRRSVARRCCGWK